MWKLIDIILKDFKSCFTRKASYKWFVIITIGRLINTDSCRITSIIRDLNINHNLYQIMLNFFRSKACDLEKLIKTWIGIIIETAPIIKEDGVKQSKEGKRMPGVKKLHQESENSTKAEYMHGAIGVLVGNERKSIVLQSQSNCMME